MPPIDMTLALIAIVPILLWTGTAYALLSIHRSGERSCLHHLQLALRERQDTARHLARMNPRPPGVDDDVVEAVVLTRSHAVQARSVLAMAKTEADLSWALARLCSAVSRSGADAGAEFDATHTCLCQSEDRAATATHAYNARVDRFNLAARHPLLQPVGRLFGFQPAVPFPLDPRMAREAMSLLLSQSREPGPSRSPLPVSVPGHSVAFGT